MAVESYLLGEEASNGRAQLLGATLEIQVFRPFQSGRDEILQWALPIAYDVVDGMTSHNDLIKDSVHMRIVANSGDVIVDTISDRDLK